MLPEIESYGRYSSGNYGAHTIRVSLRGIDLYFSYKTCIAFRVNGDLIVRQNDWGPTTGKHMNWIDNGNKKDRIQSEEFDRKFNELRIS